MKYLNVIFGFFAIATIGTIWTAEARASEDNAFRLIKCVNDSIIITDQDVSLDIISSKISNIISENCDKEMSEYFDEFSDQDNSEYSLALRGEVEKVDTKRKAIIAVSYLLAIPYVPVR